MKLVMIASDGRGPWVERGTLQPDETCTCSMCRERRARKAGMVS